jgi:cell division protein FtsW (lipid II flippase)
LLLVAVLAVGITINGARRWFDFKLTLFQPSEAAKIAVIIGLAAFISSRVRRWRAGIISHCTRHCHGSCAAHLQAADLGTALVFIAIWVAMMGISRTRLIYFCRVLVAAVPAAILLWKHLPDYQKRGSIFLDPTSPKNFQGEGYNIVQAQRSIAVVWRGMAFMAASRVTTTS